MRLLLAVVLLLTVTGCGPKSEDKKAAKLETPGAANPARRHPLAKYIELAGFRVAEGKPGELRVRFAVVNHSIADIGDLTLQVKLKTSVDKPGAQPISVFDAKLAALGPEEVKEVTVTASTRLRVYELPDWQFLRAEFDITSPAP